MITQDLFDAVLVEPVDRNANKLYIVSGYATSAMAYHHLHQIREKQKDISVNLIVGMSGLDGLSESNHRGFQKLVKDVFPKNFSCRYITQSPSVHSKVYVWCEDEKPLQAFLGSANYTQFAFRSSNRKEAMTECSAGDGLAYYQSLISSTISCDNAKAESLINIYNEKQSIRRKKKKEEQIHSQTEDSQVNGTEVTPRDVIDGLPSVEVSLLARGDVIPTASGLNWGQRKKREPNQAYLSLRADIYKTDFFPERTIRFTVYTDDGEVLICTRAQDNGKAIHTPENNSLIGNYFRKRLGVSLGDFVKKEDLEKYGRTTVDFFKIDDETYFMDFKV